jgi:hypothetical protein
MQAETGPGRRAAWLAMRRARAMMTHQSRTSNSNSRCSPWVSVVMNTNVAARSSIIAAC